MTHGMIHEADIHSDCGKIKHLKKNILDSTHLSNIVAVIFFSDSHLLNFNPSLQR